MKRNHVLTALSLLLLVLVGGWTAWWFFLATYAERLAGVAGAETARPRLEYASAERFGFPFTVGFVLRDARLTGPLSGMTGRATTTRAVLTARPWRPGDIKLDLPEGLGFILFGRWPGDRVVGEASSGSGALIGAPTQTVTLALAGLTVRPATSAPLKAERAHLEWRSPPDTAPAGPRNVAFGLFDVNMSAAALFGPTARKAEGALRLIGPLPGSSAPSEIRAWRDGGGQIEIVRAHVEWGALDLETEGTLALDEAYRLDGGLKLRIRDGVKALEHVAGRGLLTPESAALAKAAMAYASLGGGGVAAAPLTFAQGEVKLGGIRLGALQPVCDCR